MTPITEEYLRSKGFVKIGNLNSYRLEIEMPWTGEGHLLATLYPKGWTVRYMVNGTYASKIKDFTEEVDMLIEVLK